MSWDIQLAKEFRARENPKPIGACIGIVSSVEPFAGSIMDGQIMLDPSNTYVCNSLLEHERVYTRIDKVDNSESEPIDIKFKPFVKAGDMVLVLPAADDQMFFIIDVIKGVG